jgi:hypothetical protein
MGHQRASKEGKSGWISRATPVSGADDRVALTLLAVLLFVLRADVTADVAAINFDIGTRNAGGGSIEDMIERRMVDFTGYWQRSR